MLDSRYIPRKRKVSTTLTTVHFCWVLRTVEGLSSLGARQGEVIVSRDVTFLEKFEKDRKFEDFITEKIQKKFIGLYLTHKKIPSPIERNLGEEPFPLEGGDDSSDAESEKEMNPAQGEEPQEQNQQRRGRGRPRIERTGLRGRPKKIYAQAQDRVAIDQEPMEEIAEMVEISMKEAISSSNAQDWKVAIQDEFQAIIQNDTWQLLVRPKNRSVISCRIVL